MDTLCAALAATENSLIRRPCLFRDRAEIGCELNDEPTIDERKLKPGSAWARYTNGYVGRPTGGRAGWDYQKLSLRKAVGPYFMCVGRMCVRRKLHRGEHYYRCGASHARIVPEFLIVTFRRTSSAPLAFHLLLTINSFSNPHRGLTCYQLRVSGTKQDRWLMAQVLKAVIDDMSDTSVAPRMVTLSGRSLARPQPQRRRWFWGVDTCGPNLSHERWGFSTQHRRSTE